MLFDRETENEVNNLQEKNKLFDRNREWGCKS